MTQRKRKYFFNLPSTSNYGRFNKRNIPTETTMTDLLDSCLFFEEDDDTATDTENGHVRTMSDSDVIDRTAATTVAKIAQPHQLPIMIAGDDTDVTVDAGATYYNGLTLTAVDDTTAMNFKIEFTPTELTDTVMTVDDYIIFMDENNSDLPKKEKLSDILELVTHSFKKTGTTIEPVVSNDDLDMGTGDLKGGDIELESSTDRTIKVSEGSGVRDKLIIHASDSSDNTGGSLHLIGGDSVGEQGANIYVYGGTGSPDGDTLLAWNGSEKTGFVGVGGIVDNSYRLKVYDDTLIENDLQVSNDLNVGNDLTVDNGLTVTGILTLTSTVTLNSISHANLDTDKWLQSDSGEIKYRTTDEMKDDLGIGVDLWNLVDDSKYTASPASTSILNMSDTSDVEAGKPIKYYIGSTWFYGIIRTVSTNTSITIAGKSLSGNVEALYVGSSTLVTVEHFRFESAVFDGTTTAATTGGSFYEDLKMKYHYIWGKGTAAIVEMKATCYTADTGSDPELNLAISDDNITYDNVFTSNIDLDETLQYTAATVDESHYDINMGDYLELEVKAVAGNGNAQYADIWVTFVYADTSFVLP